MLTKVSLYSTLWASEGQHQHHLESIFSWQCRPGPTISLLHQSLQLRSRFRIYLLEVAMAGKVTHRVGFPSCMVHFALQGSNIDLPAVLLGRLALLWMSSHPVCLLVISVLLCAEWSHIYTARPPVKRATPTPWVIVPSCSHSSSGTMFINCHQRRKSPEGGKIMSINLHSLELKNMLKFSIVEISQLLGSLDFFFFFRAASKEWKFPKAASRAAVLLTVSLSQGHLLL